MLKFEIVQDLELNTEVLELILITHPITLTILEYTVNEVSNKNFYIREHNQKYDLKEIKQILIKFFRTEP